MAYAIFNGDPHYHLVRAGSHRTLCGLRTVNRAVDHGEYLPPAGLIDTVPHPSLFSPCPRCEAVRVDTGFEERTD